jgi:general secretion pathway protein D
VGTILAFASYGKPETSPQRGPALQALRDLAEGPPKLKPLSTSPINIKMVNDAKIIYDTLGKLAGVSVIFDPDFSPRRISVELTDLTIEQALNVVSLEAKAFWKPVTQNIVIVIPDQPQKRRDYEEQVVQTFYLSNTVFPQDLTEIVNGLRQLLDIKRVQQLNSQSAVIIRDTPDKLLLAEKIIHDVDTAKPEVVIQVEVLQTRRGKARQLGIQPESTATITYSHATSSSSSSTKSPLGEIGNLAANYSITLPGATANALLTDSTSRIIQNPELRSVDGQPAKLRVGDRVPVATGSFSASASSVNPLVNTQFQYIDVGVNIDITPRIHPNRDVSLKLAIEVSSVTGTTTIGGIQQPIISQRKIEHDIRMKEGEVSILAGLFEKIDSKSLSGWPGLAHIPVLRYLFSSESTDHQDNEVLIVLAPRVIRLPAMVQADLRPVSAGTESNVQTRREDTILTPVLPPAATLNSSSAGATPEGVAGSPEPGPSARIRFEPGSLALKAGEKGSIDLIAENVTDLFSVPLLVQYDPQVLSIEEVRYGEFLSRGNQVIALVQSVDHKRGQAVISLTRQPNSVGVSGNGIVASVVLRAIGSGPSNLSIVQINARDSQQKRIPILTGDALLLVSK